MRLDKVPNYILSYRSVSLGVSDFQFFRGILAKTRSFITKLTKLKRIARNTQTSLEPYERLKSTRSCGKSHKDNRLIWTLGVSIIALVSDLENRNFGVWYAQQHLSLSSTLSLKA